MRDLPRLVNRSQQAFLMVSLFLAGAGTLVLELIGTRLISPYYGSSLYCWSALITVTLVALAAGYSWGGRQAETHASLAFYARLLGIAGACVAVIPALRQPVLAATSPLGIQLGALASATALVAPALVLLSALGPLAIRLNAVGLAAVGRTAGDVYAVSTLGSVSGAVLAGFVLVPRLPLPAILCGLSALLLLLSAIGSYLATRRVPIGRIAAATAVFLLGLRGGGPEPGLRARLESPYGQLKVLDQGNRRFLLVNGTSQSVAAPAPDGDFLESDSSYLQSMELAAAARPAAKRALAIGLGAGLLPAALERQGLTVDAVEIDPMIAAAAREHFGYRPRGEVFLDDGRVWLERSGRTYPLIFLDAFGSEAPPTHLFTRESFGTIRRALEPGGILAINLVSLIQPPGDGPWLASYKTLRSVFPVVEAYVGGPTHEGLANVLFFCSDAPLGLDARRARPFIREAAAATLARGLAPAPERLAEAPLLTDDFAPMEALLARTSVVWRRALQANVGELLLD